MLQLSGGASQVDALADSDRLRAVTLFNGIEDFGHEFDAAFAATNLAAAQTGVRRLLTLLTNFNAAVKGTDCEFPPAVFDDVAKVRQALDAGDWEKAWFLARHNEEYARRFRFIAGKMAALAVQFINNTIRTQAGRTDDFALPFVNDPQVLGEWVSVDFVASPAEFNPDQPSSKGPLYLTGLSFFEDGKTSQPWYTWTTGIVFHLGDKTASHYEIRELQGQPYLFLEWKSKDVMIAGEKPHYYVLRKQAAKASAEDPGQSVAGLPPVVVETQPVSGARDVEPGNVEIRVRFSKEMADGSWSWSTAWENSTPEFIGEPAYESDHRTCVSKVKLEPGRTYAFWLNSEKFQNFTDLGGRPSVPYLLIFQTKPKPN
jgi:Bacterial Ig-like domain